MADRRKDCADDIVKKSGRSREEVEDTIDAMYERARAHQEGGASPREGLGKAATEMLDREAQLRARYRRAAQLDAIKSRDANRFIDAARAQLGAAGDGGKAARMAIEAMIHGINRPIHDEVTARGNQLSAAGLAHEAKKEWLGGPLVDMRQAGRADPKLGPLDKIFLTGKIEDDVFRELWALENPTRAKAGATKNAQAAKIAEILHKWDKVRVAALNGEGAWIEEYSGHMFPMSHDADKIRKASSQSMFRKGFEEADRIAWVGDTLKWMDTRRTFGSQEADKALAQIWGGMSDGSYLRDSAAREEPLPAPGAARVSQTREFHWKDADSQLAYMRKYGRFTPTQAWMHGMSYSADRFGVMKFFGTRPQEGLETAIAYAKNLTKGTPEGKDLVDWAPEDPSRGRLRNRFAFVSGEASIPTNHSIWDNIAAGIMSVTRMSKLGLTPFAMMQDNATISRELGRQGAGWMDRNKSMLGDYLRGSDEGEKNQVYELLGAGILADLQGAAARWDISNLRAGTLAKLEDIFFRWSGQTAMTRNKRLASERMMALNLGQQRGVEFGGLHEGLQRMLQAFGIGEKEWAALQRADWNEIEGTTYLTPDVALRLDDAAMKDYLRSRGTISERAAPANVEASTIASARTDLARKLGAYFAERGNHAVIEVGPRERAMLYQNTRSGEPLGIALRLMMQFKQFPVAMITRAWGADMYGGAKGLGRVAGLTELMVTSTVFGALANYLTALPKGQDPNAVWHNQPGSAIVSAFLRGGAGSIYGDFLLGEWSRFGLPASATLIGPTFGQIDRVAELWSDLTHPSKWKSGAALLGERLVRDNLPFGNMIYTKLAIDYLVHYELAEWLSPGFLGRAEQTAKTKQGQDYWLHPTRSHQIGFIPAVGEALGKLGR